MTYLLQEKKEPQYHCGSEQHQIQDSIKGYGKHEKYFIFISAGEQTYLLGNHGEYVSTHKDDMLFNDALEAKEYVDKHGQEKTSVRKIHLQSK